MPLYTPDTFERLDRASDVTSITGELTAQKNAAHDLRTRLNAARTAIPIATLDQFAAFQTAQRALPALEGEEGRKETAKSEAQRKLKDQRALVKRLEQELTELEAELRKIEGEKLELENEIRALRPLLAEAKALILKIDQQLAALRIQVQFFTAEATRLQGMLTAQDRAKLSPEFIRSMERLQAETVRSRDEFQAELNLLNPRLLVARNTETSLERRIQTLEATHQDKMRLETQKRGQKAPVEASLRREQPKLGPLETADQTADAEFNTAQAAVRTKIAEITGHGTALTEKKNAFVTMNEILSELARLTSSFSQIIERLEQLQAVTGKNVQEADIRDLEERIERHSKGLLEHLALFVERNNLDPTLAAELRAKMGNALPHTMDQPLQNIKTYLTVTIGLEDAFTKTARSVSLIADQSIRELLQRAFSRIQGLYTAFSAILEQEPKTLLKRGTEISFLTPVQKNALDQLQNDTNTETFAALLQPVILYARANALGDLLNWDRFDIQIEGGVRYIITKNAKGERFANNVLLTPDHPLVTLIQRENQRLGTFDQKKPFEALPLKLIIIH